MNEKTLPPETELPAARITKSKWRLPVVWIVPVLAAAVAGYLVYQHLHEYGPTISIQFQDVTGLKPRQTLVQYRGADVGKVLSVALSRDRRYATVKLKLRRNAMTLAREGSAFWIVSPRLGMGNVTGLGTIVSGPYIEVLPGNGAPQREFRGVEHSPTMIDPKGLPVVIWTDHGSSLRSGVPIYYRGIEVGAVRETRLSTNASIVEIHGVIRHRYAPLVSTESKFWNVTGFDVRVGLFRGAEVNVGSLKSLIIGGIAFATPENSAAPPAPPQTIFRLYEEPNNDWLKWTPAIYLPPDGEEIEPVSADLPFVSRTLP
jgi:paraquat-inducible protein B